MNSIEQDLEEIRKSLSSSEFEEEKVELRKSPEFSERQSNDDDGGDDLNIINQEANSNCSTSSEI